ncbi:MAG: hypothetical protein PHO03_06315 [Candidatus Omnitrophica bacterium]|nr:hypothetical protein [Candidatus Omnitrophota bacterium]
MAITLETDTITAKTTKKGYEIIELKEGQYILYAYGDPKEPKEILSAEVPKGKKWRLTANVYIEETDA